MSSPIVAIRSHGTIVEVILADGRPVYFDRRPFENLWEAEGGDLIGRQVEVHGDFGEQTVEFVDDAS